MATSLRKTRPVSDPYEVWQAGDWTWKVLKFYQTRENTIDNPWGRVFCDVQGDAHDLGDVYYRDIINHAVLVSSNYGE